MESPAIDRLQNTDYAHEALVRAGLLPANHVVLCGIEMEMQHNTSIIVTFLLEHVPEYRRLAELRRQGWENPVGDTFFRTQRRNADKLDDRTSRYHYKLMQKIGEELHNATMGFATKTYPGRILDMCVAPGGFLATAMKLNPESEVIGFSLPPADGGYTVLLPGDQHNCVEFLDITLLAADMGVNIIPKGHPDASSFIPRRLGEQLFDLVLCDGQVLRTHTRASYRKTCEPSRLKHTQLALGLQHVKSGGTIIVLFHKVESWDTVCFLYRFSKFACIRLYKPTTGHAKRSSFYMIATNVQSQHPQAIQAVAKWKAVWRAATFGTEEEFAEALQKDEQSAETVLEEFGVELVDHGRKVWDTQAKALVQAPFIKKQ